MAFGDSLAAHLELAHQESEEEPRPENDLNRMSPGVFYCGSCLDEQAASPEFPVTGTMNAGDVCSAHPENTPANFIRVAELDLSDALSGLRVRFKGIDPNLEEN